MKEFTYFGLRQDERRLVGNQVEAKIAARPVQRC